LPSSQNAWSFGEAFLATKHLGGCIDDNAAEADYICAGDEHRIIPFHFPEVKHGTRFSQSPGIPSLLLNLTYK
jgi:hypothetical protein